MTDADDQTLAAPDTMVGAASDETAVIPPDDAVTQLRQLAWSAEEPQTDDTRDDTRSRRQTLAITAAVLAGATLLVPSFFFIAGVLGLRTTSTDTTETTRTRGSLTEITQVPPVTETAPPVTVMAIPPTVTQTITPNPRAVFPTPSPTTGVGAMRSDVAAFNRGIAEAPPSDPMPSAALALDYGYEACNQIAAGRPRTDIEDAIAAEHGMDFGSAVWIWIQASRKLCPDY